MLLLHFQYSCRQQRQQQKIIIKEFSAFCNESMNHFDYVQQIGMKSISWTHKCSGQKVWLFLCLSVFLFLGVCVCVCVWEFPTFQQMAWLVARLAIGTPVSNALCIAKFKCKNGGRGGECLLAAAGNSCHFPHKGVRPTTHPPTLHLALESSAKTWRFHTALAWDLCSHLAFVVIFFFQFFFVRFVSIIYKQFA